MTNRRIFVAQALAGSAAIVGLAAPACGATDHPYQRWVEAAVRMQRLAESWGDQSYGAVLVGDDAIVGEGPSRVVKDMNPDAHAERVAILDAQRRLGRDDLSGTVLYSTSRPCSRCEAAARRAGVGRMFFGPQPIDAGRPGGRSR